MGKWTSTAGPIQTKRANEALRKLSWEAQTFDTIYPDGTRFSSMLLWGGGCNDRVAEKHEEIGNAFNWTVTRENCKIIIAACAQAIIDVRPFRKVEDKRTPEAQAVST